MIVNYKLSNFEIMNKHILFFCCIFLFAACKNDKESLTSSQNDADYAIQSTEAGKILLRFKPDVGDKTQNTWTLDVKPGGILPTLNTTLIADFTMRVVSVEDSASVCHLDFQRLRFNTDLMGAKVAYDSQSEENSLPQAMTAEIEKLLGKKAVIEIDSLAHLKSFDLDDIQSMNSVSSVDLTGQFITFPAEALAVGDTWTNEHQFNNVGKVEIVYTLDKVSEDEIVVLVEKDKQQENSQNISGRYLMDRRRGFIKKGELHIKDDTNKVEIHMNLETDIE